MLEVRKGAGRQSKHCSWGFPVAERTRRWLDLLVATGCFPRSPCLALSPATPSRPPAHACPIPCTTEHGRSTCLCHFRPPGPSRCVTQLVSPMPRSMSRVSCSPQVPCVPGAPDQVTNDEVPIPCMSPPPPRPCARAAATLLVDSDDKVPILCFSHRSGFL
jgi:hypothetical protein